MMESKPTYKTAEKLGIEQWEHDGLAALVGPLSRDELKMDMGYPTAPVWGGEKSPTALCGTCHCIGGWLAFGHGLKTRDQIGFYVVRHEIRRTPLKALFYPNNTRIYDLATAPQAARAIVNFLVTGDPQWDRVMAEPAQP